mmetsp:Transcript_73216/g.207024  ORF Transcript_73216/g.207024 Transcript_73216/m.207024 type:complete len:228 (+) Transcript_73216:153-836(+)
MVLSNFAFLPEGPPPQQLLDKRWAWQLLLFLMASILLLRVVGGDIAGAVLVGILFGFGIVMMRNGMQDMARYTFTYGILCTLNFFLDIVPLVTCLRGRVKTHTEPVSVLNRHREQQITYVFTKRTMPFFSAPEGVVYNMQSMAILLAPLCMCFGMALAFSAHLACQRLMEEEYPILAASRGGYNVGPTVTLGPPTAVTASAVAGGAAGAPAGTRQTFENYQGKGYKL